MAAPTRAFAALALALALGAPGGCAAPSAPPDGAPPDVSSDTSSDLSFDISPDIPPDVSPDIPPDAVTGEVTRGTFEHATATRRLRLSVLRPGLVRAHYHAGERPHPERGWTTALPPEEPPAITPRDTGDALEVRTGELVVRVRKADATLTVLDAAGRVLAQDLAPGATDGARALTRAIADGEHFYGFGEKVGPLDKRGMRMAMWNSDVWATSGGSFPPDADPLYQSIPFFVGLRGEVAYGTYVANTHRSVFDVGRARPGELRVEVAGGDLDYYFLAGPSIARVVEGFTELTGRPPMPPLWALGYQQSRWSYATEAELRAVATGLRARRIPCDGVWLDIDHMDGFRSFTWNRASFPDPPRLFADLARDGFRVTHIIDPGIKHQPGGGYAVYDSGRAGGHYVRAAGGEDYVGRVWPGDAVFPDFTRPATRAWWADLVASDARRGLAGAWIDMNEPTTFREEGFPDDARHDGEGAATDHREAHNVYALLMARATREGLVRAAPDARPFVLTRAGFAGIQRYAAVWTGDTMSTWEHLALVPPMILNLGLSGVAFAGSDVGGYSGNPSGELFARWMQAGALAPFFRSHVQTGTARQEPWSFGPEVESASRAAIELRYRLLPYLYSLFHEASQRGAPVARPLVYEFQGDARSRTVNDETMLGPSLLVAPVVTRGATARPVYLPPGAWVELATGRVVQGGRTLDVPAPLDRLPVFVRGGAIVPVAPVAQHTGALATDAARVDAYPVLGAAPSRFTLYEDDGATMAYARGGYRATPLALATTEAGAALTVGTATGSFAPRASRLVVRFAGVAAEPSGVDAGPTALPRRASADALATTDGWHWDAAARVVVVGLARPAGEATVRCRYDARVPVTRAVQVRIDVTLPAGTPMDARIHLAASLFGWAPDGLALTRVGADRATVTLPVEEGLAFEYKFTRGSWATVEKAPDCAERANRRVEARWTDGTQTVTDTVARWADGCR